MASSLLQDSMPSPPANTSSSTSRFRPYSSPNHTVTKGRYITSNDPRGYVSVYEYPLNGQWLMVDSDNGYVLWTGIWKALGNSKADIVKMLESQPELAPQLRRVRGGYLKIQGTWMPYEIALRLARRVAWPIRDDLVPLFGPTFPSTCLSPDQPGYGQLVHNPGRRKSRRITSAPVSQHQQPPHFHAMPQSPAHPHTPHYQQPESYQHHMHVESMRLPSGPGRPDLNPNEHGLALLSSAAAVDRAHSHGYGPAPSSPARQDHLMGPAVPYSSQPPQQHPHYHQMVNSSQTGGHSSRAHVYSLQPPPQIQEPYAFSPSPGTTPSAHSGAPAPTAHDYSHIPSRERGVARQQQRYAPYPPAGTGPRVSPPSFPPSSEQFAQNRLRGLAPRAALPLDSKQDGPILLPPLSSLGPPPPPPPPHIDTRGISNYSLPPITSLDSPVSGVSASRTDSSAVLRRLKLDDERQHNSDAQKETGFHLPTAEQLQRRRSFSAPPVNKICASVVDNHSSTIHAWHGDIYRRQIYANDWRSNHHESYSHSGLPSPHPQQYSGGLVSEQAPQAPHRPMSQHGQLQGSGGHALPPPHPSYRDQYSPPEGASPITPAGSWSTEGPVFTFPPSEAADTSRLSVQSAYRIPPIAEWSRPPTADVHRHQEKVAGMDDPRESACRDAPFGVGGNIALKSHDADSSATLMPSRPW